MAINNKISKESKILCFCFQYFIVPIENVSIETCKPLYNLQNFSAAFLFFGSFSVWILFYNT